VSLQHSPSKPRTSRKPRTCKIGRLPIGRYSKYLISSKRKLTRAVQALV
jgi:hypothetical protein